ncbi:septum formation initiator family protein [Fretibacter rubidus]|uniref:FtsB family cell division protein n=1 Tax=Fretibacter rubidus TaxID=570162 RepID=UPI00352ACB6D
MVYTQHFRRFGASLAAFARGLGPFMRRKWPMMALFIFYFYLAFHALSGNQGLMRWVDYEADITRNTAVLERLEAERDALQARADSLAAQNLDLDALDQQSRETLFVSHPNDYTIWLDPTP